MKSTLKIARKPASNVSAIVIIQDTGLYCVMACFVIRLNASSAGPVLHFFSQNKVIHNK